MKLVMISMLIGVCAVASVASAAQVPTSYTMANFWIAVHDTPASFSPDGAGGFVGRTTTGFSFTQQPVVNSASVRLHKFTIDQAYFYISDRGILRAETDLAAVSMYLARA
jgi:hypothetical protein